MLSQWNESEVNKKNENLSETTIHLQEKLIHLENEIITKNEENTVLHSTFSVRIQDLMKEVENSKMKLLPAVTPQKIDDLTSKVRSLAEVRFTLEKENRELQKKVNELTLDVSYFKVQKSHLDNLESQLRIQYNDENSNMLFEQNRKLAEFKLIELRLKRQIQTDKEKEHYL